MQSLRNISFVAQLPASARLADVATGREMDAGEITHAVARRVAQIAAVTAHGDRVVIANPDPLDYVIDVLACWDGGAVAVGVNPRLAPAEREIVQESVSASLWLDGSDLLNAPETGSASPAPLGMDEPGLILMTSGTTGRPKGIVHSIRSLMARAALNIAEIGAGTLRETLCVLPVFFGHGLIGNVLTPLLAGGRVHLWPTPDMRAMADLGATLDSRAISFMSSVPSFWKIALRVSSPPENALTRVHVGSAPLSMELWRDIAGWTGTRAVFNMLGMTETANWIGGGSLQAPNVKDGYVGPAWGGALAILGEDGGIGRSGRGEVLIQTPSLMLGYWQRPDLNDEAFIGGWFRSGDIGELTEDGELTLVGRLKSEINRGGIKIQAEEIDMLLERHPAIAEACAFGIPDPVAGEAVAVAIVTVPDASFDPDTVKAWCRERVRPEAVPSRFFVLDAIPRNDRGKIVRADVRAAAESNGP